MKMSLRSRAGFTLLELLAAILVVALLAALIFPTYSKHVKSAQASACALRVRATGIGMLAYAADNDNRLPGPITSQSYTPVYSSGAGYGIYNFIWSYLDLPASSSSKLARVGVCPAVNGKREVWLKNSKFFSSQVNSDDNPDDSITCVTYPDYKELPTQRPYGKNYPFGAHGDDPIDQQLQPWRVNMISQPGRLALISELPGNPQNKVRFGDDELPHNYDTHCNILFLDGHVETRRKHQKIDPDNPRIPN